MTQFLQLEAVHYAYPQRGSREQGVARGVVQDVSLQVGAGEIHVLVGRSGCGKTTLLKLAAGLLQPQQGQVRLQDQAVSTPMPEMGFVFQSPTLLNWLSVLDNILLPLQLHRALTQDDRHRAEQLLSQLGLGSLSQARPQQLSGGQQSRVAIARALIVQPTVLFMDEPFAALDAITREELQQDFSKLCRAQGIAVLFVTHDLREAVFLGDRVSLMQSGTLHAPLSIGIPHPRDSALRFGLEFNALCAQLRQTMDRGL